jgi:UDP-glucose 4-epimerase
MNNVLITGGAGFIGSYLSRKLNSLGVATLIVDNFSNVPCGRIEFLHDGLQIPVENVDICDLIKLEYITNKYGPFDYIFDLAYINGTKQFYTHSLQILQHAGVHVQNMHKIVKKFGSRWIYFSTPEIYGEPDLIPTPESHRIQIENLKNPRYSYAIGKIYSESFINAAMLSFNELDAIIVRPNNTYGATDRYHIISETFEKIINGEEITIQGSGEETRTFCYVEDIVDQILHIAKHASTGDVFSMGGNMETTINKLVEYIVDISDYAGSISNVALKTGSPLRRQPDISKLVSIGGNFNRDLKQGLALSFENELVFRSFIKTKGII